MSVIFRWVLRTVVLRSSSHSLARRTILASAVAQGSELILDLVSERNVAVSKRIFKCASTADEMICEAQAAQTSLS